VLETLESTKAQTYSKIELIITDDCSKDNTVEICRNWIVENKERFVDAKLIVNEKNTGTTANCNRGLGVANGEWIKLIAGDDILLPNCIDSFLEFISRNKNCSIVFGRMYYLKKNILIEDKVNTFFKSTPSEQKLKIYTGSGLSAPTSFIKHSLINECGGFNENYKLIEDVPMWISMARRDEYFYFLNAFVVKYRLHSTNVSMTKGVYVNPKYYFDLKRLIMLEIFPELLHLKQYLAYFNYWNYIKITDLIIAIGNRNNYLSKFLNLLILKNSYEFLNRAILLLKKVE
jgi:alpha-1,3-rhamnosyltransferase